MTRLMASTAAVLILSATASAQFPSTRPAGPLSGGIGSSPSTPGFSPYLNLSRGGSSAAANYYGIVRPQLSMQSSIQALQQQEAAGFAQEDPLTSGMVVGTRVRFLNTSGYFLNLNGGTRSPTSGGVGPALGQGLVSHGIGTGLGGMSGAFGSAPGSRGGGSRGPKN
jgi:hypothetical protein